MRYVGIFLKYFFRNILRPLSFVPAVVMMYIIFQFSASPALESTGVSSGVCMKIVNLADETLELGYSYEHKAYLAQKIEYPVRKLAHFSEYALLAVCVALPFYVYGLRGIWLVLLTCFICGGYACTDEFHQSFVPGRSPQLKDVCIDTAGAFCGVIFTRIVGFIGRKTVFRPLCNEPKKKRSRE